MLWSDLVHKKRFEVCEIEDARWRRSGVFGTKLIAATKPTKLASKILIKINSSCPQTSQEKWVKDCGLELVEDLSWRTIYLLPRLCTIGTKIRNFQFKFLHRRIATNTFLYKIGISDTPLCYRSVQNRQGDIKSIFSGNAW